MYSVDIVNSLYLTISESILRLAIELDRQGDQIRLNTLGIDQEYIKKLRPLTHQQLTQLCQFTVPFMEPTINNRVLGLAIEQFEQELHKENIYEQLLIHGATLNFIEQYTTLDKQEFTKRRKRLCLTNIGNSKKPSIEEGFQIDSLWAQLPPEMPEINKYLFAAQKLEISISTICAHHRSIGLC